MNKALRFVRRAPGLCPLDRFPELARCADMTNGRRERVRSCDSAGWFSLRWRRDKMVADRLQDGR